MDMDSTNPVAGVANSDTKKLTNAMLVEHCYLSFEMIEYSSHDRITGRAPRKSVCGTLELPDKGGCDW